MEQLRSCSCCCWWNEEIRDGRDGVWPFVRDDDATRSPTGDRVMRDKHINDDDDDPASPLLSLPAFSVHKLLRGEIV